MRGPCPMCHEDRNDYENHYCKPVPKLEVKKTKRKRKPTESGNRRYYLDPNRPLYFKLDCPTERCKAKLSFNIALDAVVVIFDQRCSKCGMNYRVRYRAGQGVSITKRDLNVY